MPSTSIYLPDDLAAQVKAHRISISEVAQSALRKEVERMQTKEATGFEDITVATGEPTVIIGFKGRWLVEPDPTETRTTENGYDAGTYWGVALTKRNRIAVYTAHCNERWPGRLDDFDTLDEAAEALPRDILAQAVAELDETAVVWRDI